MAVTYNLKGTSNPYFKIGKSGSTLFQGASDPSGSYSVENGDVWFDTTNGTLKFRSSGSWSGITTASDLVVTGDLTVQGTTTTVNSSTIDVQNSLRFEGATSDAHETILTVEDPTADRTVTIPNATTTLVGTDTTQTLTNKTITLNDSAELKLGTDEDANIKHTGSDLNINETTGDIHIRTYANDKDVKITSDDGSGGTANYILADGSTGEVKLYHYGTEKFKTTSTGAEITTTSTSDALLITTTEDSSTAGPVIALKRNSSSPADADYMGQIKFQGENDNDQEITYAKITGKILDASDGSEDGMLEYAFIKAGSQNISGRFRSDQFQLLNGTSLYVGTGGNLKFEGDTSNAYETTIAITDPTADRTITLPDDSGTVVTKDSNTGAITMPVGTTAQRPGTPATGMIRFNTDIDYFEGYNGVSWVKLGHSTPTGDERDYGAITDTSKVSNVNYGSITDTDATETEYGSVTDSDTV